MESSDQLLFMLAMLFVLGIGASWLAWRFRLPDGGVWSAGGRNNFLTGEQVGSWVVGDDLGPVCAALAG